MKQLLKDNAVLVAGVALPVLLALVFFVVITAGRWGIEPPRTSVLFAVGYNDHNLHPVKISVREGIVYMSYTPDPLLKPQPHHPYYDGFHGAPAFKIFDPVSGVTREVNVDTPKTAGMRAPFEVAVPVTKGHVVHTDAVSPDGFVFRSRGVYRNGNLMTEIFGGGRSRSDSVLEKGGYRMVVPDAPVYSTHFIGWVVPE